MILVPTSLAIAFGSGRARLRREVGALEIQNGTLAAQVQDSLLAAQSAELAAQNANDALQRLLDQEAAASAGREDAEGIDYQTLYPALYCPAVQDAQTPENTIFLTFDDGPSERTAEILDILQRRGVKATFFIIGQNAATERGRELIRRIAAEGHTLGIHTYTHVYRDIYASVADYLGDFYRTWALITEVTGVSPTVFRFPGGSINSYNRATYQEIISEMMRRGFTYYDWNVGSADTAPNANAENVRENIISGSKRQNYAVVLMHDNASKTHTVAALDGAIRALQEAGYSFDRLTPLIKPVSFTYKS